MVFFIVYIIVNGLVFVLKAIIIFVDYDVVRKFIDIVVEGLYEWVEILCIRIYYYSEIFESENFYIRYNDLRF